jgi:hypothetical protein
MRICRYKLVRHQLIKVIRLIGLRLLPLDRGRWRPQAIWGPLELALSLLG